MKINREETKNTKREPEKIFAQSEFLRD